MLCFLLNNGQQSPKLSKISKRIIIADDECELVGVISKFLMISGFSILKTFDNGRDLVEYVKENRIDPGALPDLVITDFRMPIMDGIEACKAIRCFDQNIKILLITAEANCPSVPGLFNAKLLKPFSTQQLLHVISDMRV